MPSLSHSLGVPTATEVHLHQQPFLASHGTKLQILSMTSSILQNQCHVGDLHIAKFSCQPWCLQDHSSHWSFYAQASNEKVLHRYFTSMMLVPSKSQVTTQPWLTSITEANVSLQCHYWFFSPRWPETTECRPVFLAHTITWTALIQVFASLWKFMSYASTVCFTLNKSILQASVEQPIMFETCQWLFQSKVPKFHQNLPPKTMVSSVTSIHHF